MLQPEHSVSWATFYNVFNTHFARRLRFRGRRQHKVCGTCIRHKLIIQNLGSDQRRRAQQIRFYHKHLLSQFRDRGCYYLKRASSRLRTNTHTHTLTPTHTALKQPGAKQSRRQGLTEAVQSRASSRIRALDDKGLIIISLILDGMDQAKFAWPRDERLNSSKAWARKAMVEA